jgi:hypothetical protein
MRIVFGYYDSDDIKGALRGDRPFCWVTKYDEVRSLTNGNYDDQIATQVRDKLGLDRHGQDEHLMEIDYPVNFTQVNSIAMPTVLDAGNGAVFRPWTWKSSDGWGRTVDLETLTPGLSEGVHSECNADSTFNFRYIGKVVKDADVDYENLFKYLYA